MNEKVLYQKNELLQWILSLEDESIIKEIDDLRKKSSSKNFLAEPQTEYQVKDDFDEKFEKGYTLEESKAETKRRIREWWGK